MSFDNSLIQWLLVAALTLVFFYGLDHAVMLMQGLPLTLDLRPAQ